MFDDGFDAFDAGTAYALMRHGQDRQVQQLVAALQDALARKDDEADYAEVPEPIYIGEDQPGVPVVNALDFSTVDMPESWEDYIGQEPLKRQVLVYLNSALARDAALPHVLLASGYPGVGKALPVDARVLTPTGWTTMGAIAVGDEVVGRDGKPTVVTGVFPQGKRRMYTITFSDGSTVKADGEHLWTVQTKRQRQNGTWQTLTTRQLLDRGLLNSQGRANFYIPMVEPVQHDTVIDDPVDPYLLGVLLANGHLAGHTPVISTGDRWIADEVQRLNPDLAVVEYPENTALRFAIRGPRKNINPVLAYLQNARLTVGSRDKYIPDAYFTGPEDVRRALLAGLLDCDGSVRTARGNALYHSMSPYLAEGVRTLVESLGGTARVRFVGDERGYRVEINMMQNPFRLPRKADKWKVPTRGPSRSIASITAAGMEEAVCIKVAAADELFVIDRYVVTHNTTLARLIAKAMGSRIIELVPPFNIYTLVEAARQLGDDDVLFIDEIHKLADNGKRGAEILLKVLEDKVAYLPTGEVVQLADITVIGATTDRDKLPEPVVDRFKDQAVLPGVHPDGAGADRDLLRVPARV